MKTGPERITPVQKSFHRSIKSLDGIFDFIAEFFGKNNISSNVAFSLKFAIEELFTNLVKYNPSSPSEISIGMSIDGKNIVVRISDHESRPFDPTKSPDPDLSTTLDQRRAGGLGIFLVKRMIDKIEYRHANNMSTLTLVQSMEK